MTRFVLAVFGRLRDRLNFRKTWKDLVAVGKEHGIWLFLLLLATEIVESLIAPALLMLWGWEELVPIPLLLHTEPLVIFVYMAVKKWFGV